MGPGNIKMTFGPHLVPMQRMLRAILPLRHMPVWHALEQLYLYHTFTFISTPVQNDGDSEAIN